MSPPKNKSLAQEVLSQNRQALAQAITLIESTRPDHRIEAENLLRELLPHAGHSRRIGITGIPGVGKSTFIETLGLHAINQGHRLAVLAVDPSSPRSGGAILGDKTRMPKLSTLPEAYIRPSPSRGALGGIARRTREAVTVCEAAGFDLIFVETVGVGQSETTVAELADMFVLLIAPSGGDELQGMKKGVVELADLLIVNKADGELSAAAERTCADYASALTLLGGKTATWQPTVLKCSALSGQGIDQIWSMIGKFFSHPDQHKNVSSQRKRQNLSWMLHELNDALLERVRSHTGLKKLMNDLESEVSLGKKTPSEAAQKLLDALLKN